MTLILPTLADSIPFEYRVLGNSGLCSPLAISLLESPVLSNQMFSLGPNALLVDVFSDLHERDLAQRALDNWWSTIKGRYPCQLFKWSLAIMDPSTMPDNHGYSEAPAVNNAWFCISRDQNLDLPRLSLARAVEKLEVRLEGFGQTVVAVLKDALKHLPECLTPWMAYEGANWLHWNDTQNDEELLALAREDERDTYGLITRARFFEGMPEWVITPKRMLSKEQIERAAREDFDRQVIAACDAISRLACSSKFHIDPNTCGTQTSGFETIDGMACISWKAFDVAGGIIDDMLNIIGEAGEYVEFIDMQAVPLNSQAVTDWMRRTENMMHLAYLTEKLLILIGDPF